MKVSKYDIDWQVFRVSLKKLTLNSKLLAVYDYFENNKDVGTKERLLNYLKGLLISYKDVNIKNEIEKCYNFINNIINIDNKIIISNDLSKYDKKTLLALFNNLNIRNNKWLSKGYVHKEQCDFMLNILNYLKEYDKINILKSKIDKANLIKNTHTFLY